MKKRTIRTVISLAAAVLVVCSLSVGALAVDFKTIAVTVKAGQNLEGICADHGINLGQNKKLIMSLNGFTNPSEMNRILAGSTIILPAPETEEARSYGPITIVAGDASKALPGDSVAYYIVLYTIRPGDILNDLYSQWGSSFGSYQMQMIMALNGMNNLDQLVVDKMMYLPVNRSDIPGMAYYTVFEHTFAYGESVYGVCGSYGMDYSAALATLQCLNPTMNFNNIKGGDKIYIPVSGSLAAAAMPAGTTAAMPAAYNGMADTVYADITTMENIGRVTDITSNGVVDTVSAAPGTTPAFGIVSGDPGLLPTNAVYDGFAVVINADGGLTLQLEMPDMQVCVAFTQETILGYVPRPGDYVKTVFTPTDYRLVSIQYVYNVFTGE